MEPVKQFALGFLLLFAMVNILGNMSLISLTTDNMKRRERDKVFNMAVGLGGLTAAALGFAGHLLLRDLMGVSTEVIKILCGSWIIIVALYGIITGTNQVLASKIKSNNPALIPMCFPFLAGPGTAAAIMLLIQMQGWFLASLSIFLVYLSVLPLLQLTPVVKKTQGKLWMTIVARVLCATIVIISISIVLDGFQIIL